MKAELLGKPYELPVRDDHITVPLATAQQLASSTQFHGRQAFLWIS
jgi:hypothetical protein